MGGGLGGGLGGVGGLGGGAKRGCFGVGTNLRSQILV